MNRWKKMAWAGLAAGCVAGVAALTIVAVNVHRALENAQQEARRQGQVEFSVGPYTAESHPQVESVSAPSEFTRAARFHENLYVAGPAALLEYEPSGALVREFAVGRELPPSPLVDVTQAVLADSHEDELILATASAGILAFNGRSFRRLYPLEAESREITSLAAGGAGHLLIGTKRRGVEVYDGKTLTVLHPSLAHLHVTVLAGDEANLWVGTLDRGVLHWHAGVGETYGERDGLPDPQVLSIAMEGDRAYVGTPLGVAAFERGKFERVLAAGVFATALHATPDRLRVGTEDQGILSIPLQAEHREMPAGGEPGASEVLQFLAMGADLYALTPEELSRINPRGLGRQEVLRRNPAKLTDRNISALAMDGAGRLWVGYFTRGLDELDAAGGQVTHVEDEHVFCINRILPEAKAGTVDVATANGLVRFSAAGNEEQVLTRAEGLIADHVTDVATYGEGLVLATPAGLTFLDRHGARSLYAFQGLVNNHVYALGVSGEELLAGTLGGISVIGGEAVQASYTVGNSGLQHNWITAVASVGEEWMVGTYGAGVLGMNRKGEFRALGTATGAFNVNSNAMLVTPEHVFAGSAGRGLYIYSRRSGRWTVMSDGLPSANVTALAAGRGFVYIGTDNGLVRVEEQRLEP
ncbi:MAG TPA: hypothetical protein VMV61_09705 [Patescibacteria group bacterium]|nr:hypothetical protein [Patescibacteria group bacterium]